MHVSAFLNYNSYSPFSHVNVHTCAFLLVEAIVFIYFTVCKDQFISVNKYLSLLKWQNFIQLYY